MRVITPVLKPGARALTTEPRLQGLASAVVLAAFLTLVFGSSAPADEPSAPPAQDDLEQFENKIRPLLVEHCFECHSAATNDPGGGLKLDSRANLLAGGESGPAVLAGKADDSRLIRALRGHDKDLKMPPADRAGLTPSQIDDFAIWVKRGLAYPASSDAVAIVSSSWVDRLEKARQFWSYQPIRRPRTPPVRQTEWPNSPVDAFILAKLEAAGLTPSPPAEKRALLRRATYDLTGLPPTPEELEAFVADSAPEAYSHAVDRLLASPGYGQHWGRHWLDVARYGDTRWVGAGEERRFPFAYTYRDWVIRALNQDLPYDRFVTLQLAADQLSPAPAQADLAALGFLTVGKWFTGNVHDVIDDQIDVVTRGLLGQTVQCARCHDHKYDAILTQDYYSLYGLFAASQMPVEGTGLLADLPVVSSSPVDAGIERQVQAERAAIDQLLLDRQAAVRAEFGTPEKIVQYLLAAEPLVKKLDQESQAAVKDTAKAAGLHDEILMRWLRLAKRTLREPQPIFGPWHALAALSPEEFAARVAPIVEQELAKKLNRHLKPLLSPAPASLTELANRYAELLLKFDRPERESDNDDEAIRDVLRGNESPVLLQTRELSPFFSKGEMDQIVQRRRALLQKLAQLPVAADLYLSYCRDAAPVDGKLHEFLKQRRAAVAVDIRRPERVAEHLLAAHEGRDGDEQRIRSVANKHKLSERMLRRWLGVLNRAAQQDDALFAAWRAFAAIDEADFAGKSPSMMKELAAGKHNRPVFEALSPAPTSLRQVAEAYAAAISKFDASGSSLPDADEEALRPLSAGPQSLTHISPGEADNFFAQKDRDELRGKESDLARLFNDHAGALPRGMVLRETLPDYGQRVFVRGSPSALGPAVDAGFLTVLRGAGSHPFQPGRGRLDLAQAIIDPANPLTARVIVNRVWQQHFGQALVRTTSDFGVRGEAPSHAELLDWLAAQFVADGWSFKRLHRHILLSATYRQSSSDNSVAHQTDPENRLLWRASRRRLDFEEIRDSLLLAAGRLDASTEGRPQELTKLGARRRTVYGFVDRTNLPGFYRYFDFPSPDVHVAGRLQTVVPQQALFLMNNAFVMDQAYHLARRAEAAADPAPPSFVATLYRLVYGRSPTDDELTLGVGFLTSAPLSAETAPPAGAAAATNAWRYGYGRYSDSRQRVVDFDFLPNFFNGQWRGGPQDSDPLLGRCSLHAQGGHVGGDLNRSAIRRWISPLTGKVSISGKLDVQTGALQPSGSGVRGLIVSSRRGPLGVWIVHGTDEPTNLAEVEVERGETLDFVAEFRGSEEAGGFSWSPVIRAVDAYDKPPAVWDAAKDFGESPVNRRAFGIRERYAQVLLEANEFFFLD